MYVLRAANPAAGETLERKRDIGTNPNYSMVHDSTQPTSPLLVLLRVGLCSCLLCATPSAALVSLLLILPPPPIKPERPLSG